MSDLHPTARELIEAGKRGEGELSPETSARVHRSVLHRAAALGGAATALGAATSTAKAATLGAWTSLLVAPAAVGALAGATWIALGTGPSAKQRAVTTRPPAAVVAQAIEPRPSLPSIEGIAANEPVVEVPATAAHPDPQPPRSAVTRPARSASPPERETAPLAAPAQDGLPTPPGVSTAARAEAPTAPVVVPAAIVAPDPQLPDPASPLDSAVGEGLSVLRRVHSALHSGRAEAALSLLDGADASLRSGPWAEEAQVARISALCQAGRAADAQAAIDLFRAHWPTSPLAMRPRGGCDAFLGTISKSNAD